MTSFFAIALVQIAPGFLGASSLCPVQQGAIAAAAGTAVLGLTTTTSVVNGEDLSLFVVVAPRTNAMWLLGSIALAMSLKRAGARLEGRVRRSAAGVDTHDPAVAVGMPVVAGAYWIAVGYLISTGACVTRRRRHPSPRDPSVTPLERPRVLTDLGRSP